MFGLPIDLHDLRDYARELFAAQTRAWMGAAFAVAAMFSIQYEEVFAPHVTRLTDAWTNTSTDLTRKLASLKP